MKTARYNSTPEQMAYEAGRRAYADGDECRPGCTCSLRGREYMRGYTDAAKGGR